MTDRRFGVPKTEEERAEWHEALYPGDPLPPRGTGLNRSPISQEIFETAPPAVNMLLAGIVTGLGIAIGYGLYQAIAKKGK